MPTNEDENESGGDEEQAPAGEAAPGPKLRGKQRRFLRALGHHLKAVLQIGHEGVTGAVVGQALAQLQAHELIKVRVGEGAPGDRYAIAGELAAATQSDLAQVLGRTFLLFKKRKQDSRIELP